MHKKDIRTAGRKVAEDRKVLILLHGRGGSAEDILSIANHLQVENFALLAPQAAGHTWYPYSFLAPPEQNEPGLSSALQIIAELEQELVEQGISSEQLYFLGFSQGACLTLEYVARNAKRYGGVVAFTGGLIGDRIYAENYSGDFAETPVFIGTSDPDPHVPVERVQDTTEILREIKARVSLKVYKGMPHTISQEEVTEANRFVFTSTES